MSSLNIGVIGINHKLASLALRETLASVCQRRFGAGCSIHGDHSFLLLSTCNRTEIYFSSENLSLSHNYLLNVLRNDIEGEFDQKLYTYFDHDCFLHLCRVTAGLDSAIVAETEIQGQVKAAYNDAHRWAELPSSLHFTFQKALKVAKEVRSHLKPGKGIPDLEHALLHLGKKHLHNLLTSSLLLVGASKINLKIGSFLKAQGISNITLCNRTDDKAGHFASRLGFSTIPWIDVDKWSQFDWAIVATKAQKPIITANRPCQNGSKLLIDLSVPRNIDPQTAVPNLYNIDQINELLKGRRPLQGVYEAENLITTQAERYCRIFKDKQKPLQTTVRRALQRF